MDGLKMLDYTERGISRVLFLLIYAVLGVLGALVAFVFAGFLFSLLAG